MSDMEERDMGVAIISGSGGMGSKAYTISRGSMAYQAPGSSDLRMYPDEVTSERSRRTQSSLRALSK